MFGCYLRTQRRKVVLSAGPSSCKRYNGTQEADQAQSGTAAPARRRNRTEKRALRFAATSQEKQVCMRIEVNGPTIAALQHSRGRGSRTLIGRVPVLAASSQHYVHDRRYSTVTTLCDSRNLNGAYSTAKTTAHRWTALLKHFMESIIEMLEFVTSSGPLKVVNFHLNSE